MEVSGLHVVHVVCTDAFAGVERYVANSAMSLVQAGCRVTVIGGSEAAMSATVRESGATWLPGATRAEALRSLRGIPDVDIIDTHMTDADIVGVMVGVPRRIPVVSTRHFGSRRGSRPLVRILLRAVAAAIAQQIAISGFVAQNIEGRSTIVFTGVESVGESTSPREPIVILVQRLEAEKRTDIALAAWALVPEHGPWRLVVVGDGTERVALHAQAVRLGIAGSVDFVGFQSDVDSWLRRASIFLAPTPREGLGLAVIEAMAHAVPVVAADGGGHLETVGATEGAALFAVDDPRAAAAQLVRLIADPDERERYGRALRDRQRSVFHVSRQTDLTLRVFADAAR